MAKLRRDTQESLPLSPLAKPLRIVASGTLFLTHTLTLPNHPTPSSIIRARSVEKVRGGSANTLLSVLAQFSGVEAVLVAPLGGNDEGKMIISDLQREGVNTHYCKVWPDASVPSAWVLHSEDGNTRAVINHNPLPDITHEEFVTILGPLLAPENYAQLSPNQSPTILPNHSSSSLYSTTRTPHSGSHPTSFSSNPSSPAPFDWLHFEGRSVKTTLYNITGIDGLARERKWRNHCVFSVDVGRKGRQGVEALIPHADVLFVNKQYAQSISPQYAMSPRAFLLSLTSNTAPHALLVAHWGSDGSAVLSVPTREYFQSSGWVEERPPRESADHGKGQHGQRETVQNTSEFQSVRSGSAYWADGRGRSTSSSASVETNLLSDTSQDTSKMSASFAKLSRRDDPKGKSRYSADEEEDTGDDNDSQGTETPAGDSSDDSDIVDELGAQDAFIAGMIYAISRKLCPGSLYTPFLGEERVEKPPSDNDRMRWRLDECLRFATELAGRRARRRNWDGLADEMTRAGWFDH
ncbi:hypothetical protein AX17_002300 [Amanita inopinata Kibby_2008]|nr:hypothetical protein AX17_002300 [Amanita inopinata Kibby_2008]